MLIPWLPDETEQRNEEATLLLLPLAKQQWTFLFQPRYFMRLRKFSADAVSGKHCVVVKTHPLSYDCHLWY